MKRESDLTVRYNELTRFLSLSLSLVLSSSSHLLNLATHIYLCSLFPPSRHHPDWWTVRRLAVSVPAANEATQNTKSTDSTHHATIDILAQHNHTPNCLWSVPHIVTAKARVNELSRDPYAAVVAGETETCHTASPARQSRGKLFRTAIQLDHQQSPLDQTNGGEKAPSQRPRPLRIQAHPKTFRGSMMTATPYRPLGSPDDPKVTR
jgi:hypothetical protein